MAKKLVLDPFRMGPSTLEDMDINVLRFQHNKLKERLELRQKQENDLKDRIEQLEKRQKEDDAVLNVINRYWNQFNEDILILLQRFDREASAEEPEVRNENEATTSFLTQLSIWDKHELDEKLANRVQVSTEAVTKIVTAFHHRQQHNEEIAETLRGENLSSLNEAIRDANIGLEMENHKIEALNVALQEKCNSTSLKMKQVQEKLTGEATRGAELQNKVDDLNWEVSKLISQNQQLKYHVQNWTEKYRKLQQLQGSCSGPESSRMNDLAQQKVEMTEKEVLSLQKDNEGLRELASNRSIELEQLHQSQREILKEMEELRKKLCQLPESVVVETTEYKCLQSKFSVSYKENLELRAGIVETRAHVDNVKAILESSTRNIPTGDQSVNFQVQKMQKKQGLRLMDLQKDSQSVRAELGQSVAVHQQTGPISREMRHLITSLQKHNQLLKGDVSRYRKKYKDICLENPKLKCQRDELEKTVASVCGSEAVMDITKVDGNEDELPSSSTEVSSIPGPVMMECEDDLATSSSKAYTVPIMKEQKKESTQLAQDSQTTSKIKPESDNIKELRSQLKKALNEQKEMKLLLDMYKGASKDQRDKVQLMASERKTREELEQVREAVNKLQDESKKEERKKLADEDAMKRIKSLEEQIFALNKQVSAQKQEEEALISEMEVTGQAFEDIQEQNSRLIQQLREKDDANFKLMTDRIKSNRTCELIQEERDLLQEQATALKNQFESQTVIRAKLEVRDKLLEDYILGGMEREAGITQQATEAYKRKAIESAQSAADLKLHLEKYHSQMKDAQQTVAEKTCAMAAEAFKSKRLQEEILLLKRKLEGLNQVELAAGSSDEVSMEEIREYKESLTCPSCKVKRKDAVLTKCFHVFCFDCLRTRYETRQRKCPKCYAAFGANDYHRIYLS